MSTSLCPTGESGTTWTQHFTLRRYRENKRRPLPAEAPPLSVAATLWEQLKGLPGIRDKCKHALPQKCGAERESEPRAQGCCWPAAPPPGTGSTAMTLKGKNSRCVSSRSCSLLGGRHQLLLVSLLSDGKKHEEPLSHFHAALTAFVHFKSIKDTLLTHNHSLDGWKCLQKAKHNCLCFGLFISWLHNNVYDHHRPPLPKQEHVSVINSQAAQTGLSAFRLVHMTSQEKKQTNKNTGTSVWYRTSKPSAKLLEKKSKNV